MRIWEAWCAKSTKAKDEMKKMPLENPYHWSEKPTTNDE